MASGSVDAFGHPITPPPAILAEPPPRSVTPRPGGEERVPHGAALADPLTAAALARYRARGRWIAAVGLGLLIAFVALVNAQGRESAWLLRHGTRTSGRIVAVARNAKGAGSFSVEYIATGRPRLGRITLTETSGFYASGEAVTVIYDPRNPSEIRTPVEENEPAGTVAPLMLLLLTGLILFLGGAGTLLRAWRWRALMSRSSWRPYRAHVIARAKPRRFAGANEGVDLEALGSPSQGPVLLRQASTWKWRTGKLVERDGDTVWLAGEPTRQAVLAVPATRELIAVAAARGTAGRDLQRGGGESRERGPAEVAKQRRTLMAVLVFNWAMFGALSVLLVKGSALGPALVGVYTLALLATVVSLRRAWTKQDTRSAGG